MDLISEEGIDDLSKVVIYFTLPALIFSNFIGSSKFEEVLHWWIYPLGMAILVVFGIGLGLLVSSYLEWPERRQFGALLGFPNTGYLPLALVATLLTVSRQSKVNQLIFLLILGSTPSLWSIGVGLLSGKAVRLMKFLKGVLSSPPFLTILISLGLIFTKCNGYIPDLAIETAFYAGDVTVPLIMIVLGGTLARMERTTRSYPRAISMLVLIKLVAYPGLALTGIYFFHPPELLGFVILLETATPPATNLAVIGSHYGDSTDLLNQGLFYSYLSAILTIPVFISLFRFMY